jgi:hypothetical protein
MPSSSQSDVQKILQLVGAIVLVSQDAERYLKMTLPFIGSKEAGLDAAFKRLEKLKKRTLGELAEKLVDSATSDSTDFAEYMAYLVASRNQVVHHFNETFSAQLSSGAHQDIVSDLEGLHTNLKEFRSTLEQMALLYSKDCGTTFRETRNMSFSALRFFPSTNCKLTIHSSGPLRRSPVTSCGTRQAAA